MNIVDRQFQTEAVESIWRYFRTKSGNPIVAIPTGAGKSIVIARFLQSVFAIYPHQKVLILTHRKELIQQNYEKLLAVWPFAPAGIYSDGLGQKVYNRAITFAGVASVYRRPEIFGRVDLVIIDEAHLVSPHDNTMYQTFLKALYKVNPYLKIIGLTATPWRLGHGLLTDPIVKSNRTEEPSIFSDFCFDITGIEAFNRLIREGFLVPLVPKRTDTLLSVDGVHMRGGEFIEKELQTAVDKEEVTYAALKEALELGAKRRKWLIFATGIEHADHITDMLHMLGVSAGVVHSRSEDRDGTIAAFKAGQFRAIVNANVLCLDEETEILTSDGFVGIDEMSYEHKIAAWKKDGGIEFTNPEFIVRRNRKPEEKMVTFGKGMAANIRVTGNHRTVYRTYDNRIEVKSASECVGRALTIPSNGVCEPQPYFLPQPTMSDSLRKAKIRENSYNYRRAGMTYEDAKAQAIERIDARYSLRYKNPHELNEDECRFVGFWLGDGCISGGRCVIGQSERYLDNIEWFRQVLKGTGFHYTEQRKPIAQHSITHSIDFCIARGTGSGSQQVKGYFSVEPYLDKKGNAYLFHLSKKQLECLLEGFWRADGNHHSGGNSRYVVGTQFSLYNILQAVCSMRGIRAVLTKIKRPKSWPEHYKDQWRLGWSNISNWAYVKNSIVQETEYKKERVWCVTSSTSFLICRRKGKVFVTGNTTGFDDPKIDMIICLRPTASTVLWVQMMGRGTRPVFAPGYDLTVEHERLAAIAAGPKQNCLVLDYAGNTKRLGPINDPVIPRRKGQGGGMAPIKCCDVCHTWVHASLRFCDGLLSDGSVCGHEFKFETKLNLSAGTDELIKGDMPIVEVIKVDHITIGEHKKLGRPNMVKLTYYCGLNRYNEFICPEHEDFAKRQAIRWWRARSKDPLPATTPELLEVIDRVPHATHLRVWINKEFPEILAHCFDGSAFGTEEPTDRVPEIQKLGKNETSGATQLDADIPF
jgi:superfamily II DNA or RNA helicase